MDNWKHRSSNMKCKTCMWFMPKQTIKEGTIDTLDPVYNVGRCRKHSPSLDGWPVLFVNDWCGDHKLNEVTLNVEG